MKTLILLSCLACSLSAQTYVRTNMQITATLTNGPNPYTNTNFVDATRYGEAAFELSFQGSGTNTEPVTVAFVRSADGTNYESAPWFLWPVAANSNTVVRTNINFALGAVGYIKPSYTTNAGYFSVTNAALWGILKGYRRD